MEPRRGEFFSFLLLGLVVCAPAGVALAEYSGGLGTPEQPWRISTPNDLATLSKTPGHWGNNFVQLLNIDMKGHDPIGPIGTSDARFTGTYQGAGFRILDLTLLGATQAQPGGDGLFGVVAGMGVDPVIQRVILENPMVLGASQDTGALVGRLESGIVRWCGVKGGYVSGTTNTGGLAGQVLAQATVKECYSTTFVMGAMRVGGLVGLNCGLVEECYCADNSVTHWGQWPTVPDSVDLGGLVGCNSTGRITGCYANCARIWSQPSGFVSVHAGGLVGRWILNPDEMPFPPFSFSNQDTPGLAWPTRNALGAPSSTDSTAWSNIVAQSVPMNATSGWLLRQRSTFKYWDFNYVWTIQDNDTPKLQEVPQ